MLYWQVEISVDGDEAGGRRTERGPFWWKVPAQKRRQYHSRAAREDRDGPARYSGHERRRARRKQGGTVEFTF